MPVPGTDSNRSKWIEAIEKVQPFDYITQNYHVCQFHFLPEDIEKKGKKKFVIFGRVPSVFTNIQNIENEISEYPIVSVIEENGNSCEATITADVSSAGNGNINAMEEPIEGYKVNHFDSESSNIQYSNMHAIEANSNSCEATILNSTDVHDGISDLFDYGPEYLSENSSDTNHETPNQTIPGNISYHGCNEETIRITKAEYKKLIDETVELARLKVKIGRMENSLKEKSDKINQLQQKVRYYEHTKAKEISEESGEKDTNQSSGAQMDDDITKVIKIHSEKSVLIYPRHYHYFRNINNLKFWNVYNTEGALENILQLYEFFALLFIFTLRKHMNTSAHFSV